jgi:hypothetical protein
MPFSARVVAALAALALTSVACSSKSPVPPADQPDSATASPDASTDPSDASLDDADAPDASDAGPDKSAACASTFGAAIGTVGFQRFDGTLLAIVPPGDLACAMPNSTHLVLQLQMQGAVYRMVVDVSDVNKTGWVGATTKQHALVGDAWSDGWHAVPLDYVGALGLHSTDFTQVHTADAVASITSQLTLGAHVSVFATAAGEKESAHLVHKSVANQDGAIVFDVDGSPSWLLFAFADQTF